MRWRNIAAGALLIGLGCATCGVMLSFINFTFPNATLDRLARSANLPGTTLEKWLFATYPDPYRQSELRMAVTFVTNTAYYSLLALLVILAIALVCFGRHEKPIARSE